MSICRVLTAVLIVAGIMCHTQPVAALYGGFTQFNRAIEKNDFPAFCAIYEANAGNGDALQQALHYAIGNNRLEMVRFLHEHGVALTPAVVGLLEPNDESCDLLVYVLDNCDTAIDAALGQTLLARAASTQSITALQYLADYGIPLNAVKYPFQRRWRPLICLAMENERPKSEISALATVTWLVEHGAPVNEKDMAGITPLKSASYAGNSKVVNYLLLHGAVPDVGADAGDCSTARHNVIVLPGLWHARGFPVLDIVVFIGAAIAWRFGRQSRRNRWLVIATLVILIILRLIPLFNSASINARDQRYGRTLLFIAAEGGDLPLVRELLAAGANSEIPDYDRVTPLVIAAQRGHDEVVRYFIAGKKANAGLALVWCLRDGVADGFGHATPYSVHERETIIDCLCRNGTDLNTRVTCLENYGNDIPIVTAAWQGTVPMVKTLLRHGAELTPYKVNGGPSARGEALQRALQNDIDPGVLPVLISASGPIEFDELHQVGEGLQYADFERLMLVGNTLRCPVLTRDQQWGFCLAYALGDRGAARLQDFDRKYPGLVTPAIATFALRATLDGLVFGAWERQAEFERWLLRKGANLDARDWDGKRIRDVFKERYGLDWEVRFRRP